jgi:hypothetical protein
MQDNSSNSISAGLPVAYLPPMALDRFCEITGLSPVTAWRMQRKGMLKTHLIANRRYILAEDLAEFNRRVKAGEFAGKTFNPSAHRKQR